MFKRVGVMSSALSLGAAAVFGFGVVSPAQADTAPADANEPKTVSSDPLPTAQIDGVAWTQAVVGDRVFVGGSFTTARPAGSPAGTNTVPRANIMAFDINTGALDQNFKPVFDGQILSMALSPDKSTLYVGGDFTKVDGQWRVRLAAFDTATGQLKANFRPVAGSTVRTLAANDNTVFFGGDFTAAGDAPGVATVARPYLAAADAANGAIRPNWNPTANASVTAMTMTDDLSKVVVGGRFTSIGADTTWYGMAALDPATGAPQPWAATSVLRNAGTKASWTSFTTDEQGVYGTGYVFGAGGNFEGAFRADNSTGQIQWAADCHGDHYTVFPKGDVAYTTSHHHYCGNVDRGFPQTEPWTSYFSSSLTNFATAPLLPEIHGYANFAGQPGPSQLNWFPTWLPGTATPSKQAGWSINGNDDYITVVGEFIGVNGAAQQGLVRFANADIAPNKVKPSLDATLTPALSSHTPGEVRVGWLATHDRDNSNLTYKVYRNFTSVKDTPVFEVNAESRFWKRPGLSFTDKGLAPGSTQEYRVLAFDPFGNYVAGDPASVVVTGDTQGLDYRRAVLADSPLNYFPLDSVPASGRLADLASSDSAVSLGGVTANNQGALLNSSAGSASFNGTASNGYAAGLVPQPAPDATTVEAWVKTTSTSGGRIVGYSVRRSGTSGVTDRVLYMDNAGRVNFGVDSGGKKVLTSAAGFNDGNWHHVVGSLGGNGMRLSVDGKFLGSREDAVTGRRGTGYWRIGGDTLSGWANAPASGYLNGSIDEVAIYPAVLSRGQVDAHYVASGRTSSVNVAPADAYGQKVFEKDPELYWRLEEASGTQAADSGTAGNRGAIQGGVTLGQSGALFPNAGNAGLFNGTNAQVVASQQATNPRQFTAGVWFKTTTTKGGKLIGFGNAASGLSASYDRHLYMQDDGKVVFGVYDGQTRTLTTGDALNDGKWHMAVGTMAADGMKLYVDGKLVGSNGFASAQNYAGYWRIGGDRTWGSTSSYFNGTLDEAMVFSRALNGEEITELRGMGVEPPPNAAPVASFTTASSWMDVTVDGSGSSDADGSIADYAWDFGDGQTVTGATPSTHTYASPGTYTVSLTVTDNAGATHTTSQSVEATAKPNQVPVASFTVDKTWLEVTVDGNGSSDPDGSIDSYSWDFGDGTSANGATPAKHTYGAAGTYTISLTVTDNQGATTTATQSVEVAAKPNEKPKASFTATPNALEVSVNAGGSSDADGTIDSYEWQFGDGSTGSGKTASHTFASPGTYTVTLTVTDDKGASDVATRDVAVSSVLAEDNFGRTASSGWGTADKGGAWSACNATCANLFSVSNGAGQVSVKAGSGPEVNLAGVSSTSTDMQVELTVDRAATGGGSYSALTLRGDYRNGYRGKARIQPDGSVQVSIVKVVNGAETTISDFAKVPAGTFTAGTTLVLRGQAVGTSPTQLKFKVWKKGTAEPAGWTVVTTDSTADMQKAGGIGLWSFLSGTSTNGPAVYRYDNLLVRSAS